MSPLICALASFSGRTQKINLNFASQILALSYSYSFANKAGNEEPCGKPQGMATAFQSPSNDDRNRYVLLLGSFKLSSQALPILNFKDRIGY